MTSASASDMPGMPPPCLISLTMVRSLLLISSLSSTVRAIPGQRKEVWYPESTPCSSHSRIHSWIALQTMKQCHWRARSQRLRRMA
ncbi:MAG: hypothetical protein J3Q66DRAFT_320770 [Benniella sp.]|nr:MAG: hypothetical protein J3Q66DRAFT_320770 [Benniella sp.]